MKKLLLPLTLLASLCCAVAAFAQGLPNDGGFGVPNAGSSGGGGGLNGFLTCTAGVCTFTGADGSTQMVVGTANSAVDFLQVVGGISGAGPSFLCQSGTDANVPCNTTAKGTGSISGSNGSGKLYSFVDPGGIITGTFTFTPGIGTAPANISAPFGINLGGVPILTSTSTPQVWPVNINGDFQVDQINEGSSFTPASSGLAIFDAWRIAATQNAKFAFQRVATSPISGYRNAAQITVAATVSPAATDTIRFSTVMTGTDASPLQWGLTNALPVMVDICVLGNASLTYPATIPVYLNNNDFGSAYQNFIHLVTLAASATQVCTSFPVPVPSGSWVGSFGNASINMGISLCAGSNFQTATTDAWVSNSTPFYTTSGATNLCTVSGGVVTVTGIRLRAGTFALPYYTLPYEVVLAQAQRRYWKSFSPGTKPATQVGINTGEIQFPATVVTTGTQRSGRVLFPVQMDAAPSTVTFFNPRTGGAGGDCADETATADGGAGTSTNATANGLNITCTGNAATALNNIIGVHVTVDSGL